jgi:mono/diheme cytochrome c family protein
VKRIVWWGAVGAGILVLFGRSACTAQEVQVLDEANRAQLEFFESKIRPIFVEHCYACHSANAETIEAGLILDSKWGWETGGDSGPAIKRHDVEGSLLIDAVRRTEKRVSGMPPSAKLAPAQIEALEKWVAMGAPDSREKVERTTPHKDTAFDLDARVAKHWAWRAVVRPDLPEVADKEWALQPLDRFVLARLEAAGLRPAPTSDKSVWLRRVYFDLIGLPPKPEQIKEFLANESPEAFEHVVEQLLQSEHFGEKWARHWMDLVRYAESYGHEFDFPIDHGFEYRDYLIRAFNADVPYNQFVLEHIAGDLLAKPRLHSQQQFNESVIGTGFWYWHDATHAPTDSLGNEANILDNQIDVFGKTFLGLTIACARCHDHKFDAISTADYYALSAYLKGTCRQEYPLDSDRKIEQATASIHESLAKAGQSLRNVNKRAAIERVHRFINASIEVLDKCQKTPWNDNFARVIDETAKDREIEVDVLRKGVEVVDAFRRRYSDDVAPSLPQGNAFATFDGPTLPQGWSTTGSAFVPVGEQVQLRTDGSFAVAGTIDSSVYGDKQAGILRSPSFEISSELINIRMKSTSGVLMRVVIDGYLMAGFRPLLFEGTRFEGDAASTGGQWVWKSFAADLKRYIGHRAYIEFVDSGEGTVAIDEIRFSNTAPSAPVLPNTEALAHVLRRARADSMQTLPEVVEQLWQIGLADLAEGKSSEFLRLLRDVELLAVEDLSPEAARHGEDARAIAESIPAPRLATAMADGTLQENRIYIRGNHNNLGDRVPPRFLAALGAKPGSRLELAHQVASE